MRLLLPAVLIALVAAAPAARDRVPAATPAGPAVSCLRLADIRQTLVRDDRTIDFVTSGRGASTGSSCPMPARRWASSGASATRPASASYAPPTSSRCCRRRAGI